MKKVFAAVLLIGICAFSGVAGAAMMGNGGGTGSMMGGNGAFTTANGSFGMMNGMAGSPVVGDDGTAYLVTYDSTASQGTPPASNVFQSRLMSIDTAGNITSLSLNGIVSRPVVADGYVFASASMSNLSNYMLVGDYRNSQGNGQSVVYAVPLHFDSSTKPVALAIDGDFASVPVIAQNHLYILGSDFGNAMMTGSNTFSMMYGNYNFNSTGTAKTYMYIFNLDGSLVSKTLIQ
ncbi:MAG: hypothetical protein M0024_03385 [Nitrospiraceae bacterium]|nr:hypothetical protein [Nitrospiraceae bacterium]